MDQAPRRDNRSNLIGADALARDAAQHLVYARSLRVSPGTLGFTSNTFESFGVLRSGGHKATLRHGSKSLCSDAKRLSQHNDPQRTSTARDSV
jgi:hypothetical protein